MLRRPGSRSRSTRQKRRSFDRSFDELVEERFGTAVGAEVVARGLAGDVDRTLCQENCRRRITIVELAEATQLTSTDFSRVSDEREVPPLDLLQRIAHALGMPRDLPRVRTAAAESP
jgi:hypothetical protein